MTLSHDDVVAAAAEAPPPKRRRVCTGNSTNSFLRSWAWKREHRPDSVRFEQPYMHRLRVPGQPADQTLTIKQAPFDAHGFASTVWDSSIVMAKFLEKHALAEASAQSAAAVTDAAAESAPAAADSAAAAGRTAAGPAAAGQVASAANAVPAEAAAAANAAAAEAAGPAASVQAAPAAAASCSEPGSQLRVRGSKLLDLSAGCGLVGIAAACLGAEVTATDLGPNLPLLQDNCAVNGPPKVSGAGIRVVAHEWGSDTSPLQPPFDTVVACDIMYIDDASQPLIRTLAAVAESTTRIYVAHGRNRQAETSFMAAARKLFSVEEVPGSQLDELYQCSDVSVLLLQLKLKASCRP